jgi:ABC-type Fe3+/spermidine/putrescine transport system ATPase subunit
MSHVLEVTSAARKFGASTILSGVNVSLDQGERLAVLGSSGSGKTTLLRIIAGLEAPSAGEVWIDGKLASRPAEVLIPPERRGVALVFQGLALFPHLRALDQIAFAARGRGGVSHARELLERIGLGHRASAALDELSGGERQRIALARGLAQRPRLLLMDEPFASLDDARRAEMRELLRSLLASTDATLILVTHSRDDALDLADRVLVLDRGRTAAAGRLADVLERPAYAAAARALGLGQLIPGHASAAGDVETPFGTLRTRGPVPQGLVTLLVRPGQPALSTDGVAGEIVSIALRPGDGWEPQRIAVVRCGHHIIRVILRDPAPRPGDLVHVRIDGPCEVIST